MLMQSRPRTSRLFVGRGEIEGALDMMGWDVMDRMWWGGMGCMCVPGFAS